MVFLKRFVIIFVFIFIGCTQQSKMNDKFSIFIQESNTSFLCQWNVKQTTLVCAIAQQRDSLGILRTMTIYDTSHVDCAKIFTYSTADAPLALFQLGESDGNLASIWIGGSAYHFIIFSYINGKIVKVLEKGSRVFPEFVYFDDIDESGIIITEMDWQINPKNKENELIPLRAQVYKWKNGRYEDDHIIPWKKRFQMIY
jgi:hypothetical protein